MVNFNIIISPKQQHYDCLEVDEFWTYVGNKKNKIWLIYAYNRATGKIVNCVWAENHIIGKEIIVGYSTEYRIRWAFRKNLLFL